MFGFRKNNRQAPPTLTSKLGVEMLESREVPANFYWDPQSPTDLNSTTLSNWLNPDGVRCGVQQPFGNVVAGPNSDDTLIFGADLGGMPGHGTIGVGGTGGGGSGPSYNTLNCELYEVPDSGNNNGPVFDPYDYFGWIFHPTYGVGTVKLHQSSYVNYYEMRGGNLNQLPLSGGGDNHVTVNNLLTWTAGTINTNAQAGFLNLNVGAHGWIDPGDGNTVTTGNTIICKGDTVGEAGSNLTIHSGTTAFSKGEGIKINSFASLNLSAEKEEEAEVKIENSDTTQNGRKALKIDTDARITVQSIENVDINKRYHFKADGFVMTNAGKFTVETNVTFKLTGSYLNDGVQCSLVQDESSESQTYLRPGAVLKTKECVNFTKGTFYYSGLENATQAQDVSYSIVVTDVPKTSGTWGVNFRGSVYVQPVQGNNDKFPRLKIDSNVRFDEAASLYVWLSFTDTKASGIDSSGYFSIGSTTGNNQEGPLPGSSVTFNWDGSNVNRELEHVVGSLFHIFTAANSVSYVMHSSPQVILPFGSETTFVWELSSDSTKLSLKKTN